MNPNAQILKESKMKKLFLLLAIVFLLGGCIPPPVYGPYPPTGGHYHGYHGYHYGPHGGHYGGHHGGHH